VSDGNDHLIGIVDRAEGDEIIAVGAEGGHFIPTGGRSSIGSGCVVGGTETQRVVTPANDTPLTDPGAALSSCSDSQFITPPVPDDQPLDWDAALEPWLDSLPKPIGLMAATDARGRQVINCVTSMGLRVPDDVGVLGVDDNEFASALAARTLSSVQLNAREIGHRAAQMLDHLFAGAQPCSPYWVPPLGVKTRQSTDVTISADALVTRARGYIREHCTEPMTVEDVLEAMGVSRTTLEVRMKRAIGKTPQVAITSARVERAKQQLVATTLSVRQIARACGFDRHERLNVVFKRHTGLTPGEFRQQRSR
jgi:AraC-like DNA-binding protein